MIAAAARAAHVSWRESIGRLENLLALSGISSLKQKTVCNRAQLCKIAEEIIVCWNAIGLEFSQRSGDKSGQTVRRFWRDTGRF